MNGDQNRGIHVGYRIAYLLRQAGLMPTSPQCSTFNGGSIAGPSNLHLHHTRNIVPYSRRERSIYIPTPGSQSPVPSLNVRPSRECSTGRKVVMKLGLALVHHGWFKHIKDEWRVSSPTRGGRKEDKYVPRRLSILWIVLLKTG